MGTIRNEPYNTPSQSVTENSGTSSVNPQNQPGNLPISPKKVKKIRKFLKCFIAVDNDVNEHTVMGVFFAIVTLVIVVLRATGIGEIEIEVFNSFLIATCSCFGIGGFKR